MAMAVSLAALANEARIVQHTFDAIMVVIAP